MKDTEYEKEILKAVNELQRCDSDRAVVIMDMNRIGYAFYYHLLAKAIDDEEVFFRYVCGRDAQGALTRYAVLGICLEHIGHTCGLLEFVHSCDGLPAKSTARAKLQIALGKLLGYSKADCVDFTTSRIGLSCPCTCCGGDPSPTE